MAIRSVSVKVDLSEVPKGGPIYFYVGNHGFPCPVDTFKEYMKGASHDGNVFAEHLIRNIAIRAALANLEGKTLAEIKASIESATFQV